MKKFLRILKSIVPLLYLLGIFYLLLNNEAISEKINIPLWSIPAVALVSLIYLAYLYIDLYFKVGRLEYQFTSVVNHTFRTPITSIFWFTKELEKDLIQSEKLLYLQNIDNSINKILGIVDIFAGIKDVNDISSYFFKATSLREVVEKSLEKYREAINKKNIKFNVSTFKGIPLLTVDLKKITFVVDTLVENAILYTKNDGRILITCSSNSKKLTLIISNNGLGLKLVDKMRIFSKFYRGEKARLMNTDGMGLRLYLSKQIVKRHHGKIYAKSKGEDEGTTFFVELPFRR